MRNNCIVRRDCDSFTYILKMADNTVVFVEDIFGKLEGQDIKRFTWTTPSGFSVQVITYGATITSIKVPDNDGKIEDVVLGFDNIEGYTSKENPYFGATVGRCANRIGGASFVLNTKRYQLAKNVDGGNHLHGGIKGFNAAIWESFIENDSKRVVFSYLSKDNEEGYPGDLLTQVTYEVTSDDTIKVEFSSTTTKPTIINLTNHSYFNLGGHVTGAEQLYEHIVTINADKFTLTDSNSIPSGQLASVMQTPYDLRVERKLGDLMAKVNQGQGFDDNFCIVQYGNKDVKFIARAIHPRSRRSLEVYSNQPGVQFYTSNHIPDSDSEAIRGKSGALYKKHAALCFETQNYPDAINHINFPNPILNPGERYVHRVIYKFAVVHD